ncbi:hypothetical protein IMZ08_17635 [Bacillus luteolus]|uniref:DUF4829 domain-containing protein n=1 Tax=Litchfieldia luteola TaxID=682179 RepID=A0ABR9QMY1_9BACI|nr:hypothetical protein [Cytobacillus luteolus]MBE4909860.1 hypothetical protein [Cytobacillus luteolus]MBP1942590.1 hypothetical protein [Cytobacillus luteolus]
MKKIVGLFIVILFLTAAIFYGDKYITYSKMKDSYKEPYLIVENLVQEAEQDKNFSNHVLSEKEWRVISHDSVYRIIREPLDWKAFKEFVQECKRPTYSLSYPNGKATLNVMERYYKDNMRSISLKCFEFDEDNGEEIGVRNIILLMQNIKSDWKVVGIAKESIE